MGLLRLLHCCVVVMAAEVALRNRRCLLLKEDGLPVDTPRYDILREIRDEVAWLKGHAQIVDIAFPSSRKKAVRFH